MNKEQEIGTITRMVRRYYRSVHETGGRIFHTKHPLPEHVKKRRGICPHGDNKPFCSICHILCYNPEMRQPLRAVIRYAEPRTLLRHMAETLRKKRRSSHAGSTAFAPVGRG